MERRGRPWPKAQGFHVRSRVCQALRDPVPGPRTLMLTSEKLKILTLQGWEESFSSQYLFPTSWCGIYGKRCVCCRVWGLRGEHASIGSTSIRVRVWWRQQETHLRCTRALRNMPIAGVACSSAPGARAQCKGAHGGWIPGEPEL